MECGGWMGTQRSPNMKSLLFKWANWNPNVQGQMQGDSAEEVTEQG